MLPTVDTHCICELLVGKRSWAHGTDAVGLLQDLRHPLPERTGFPLPHDPTLTPWP